MRILGIDCGLAITGWSIVEKDRSKTNGMSLIAYGVIETAKNLDISSRLVELQSQLATIIETYQPSQTAIEELFYFKNAKTVIAVAQARGVILACCQAHNLAIYEYTPLQVKMAVTGSGRAEKAQVQQMVKTLLKMPEIPKPDDAADAIAIAIKHSFTNF